MFAFVWLPLYKTKVRPQLEFAVGVYTSTDIYRLERVQRKTTHIVQNIRG